MLYDEFSDNKIEDMETYELISPKLAAVNNRVRFSIVEILLDIEKANKSMNFITKEPLYSREINSLLLEKYDISITPQMLGQHLKQLVNAGLIYEVSIKKEIPNKIGSRTVKAYRLNTTAFKDLFLNIDIFTHELLSLFKLYEIHKHYEDGQHCILTVLNGKDKGKTFIVKKEEKAYVGRDEGKLTGNLTDLNIILDESYITVSGIAEPHLKVYYYNEQWCIQDNSCHGTYINNKKIKKGNVFALKNNCFVRLSQGDNSTVFYCSY